LLACKDARVYACFSPNNRFCAEWLTKYVDGIVDNYYAKV
jgi:hypothetical protein